MADDKRTTLTTEEQIRVSFGELGTTGLSRWGGQVTEGFVKELQGDKGRKIFREMAETDPIIGASLLVLELIMRTAVWNVETDGESDSDNLAVEFVQSWMDDMSHSWSSFVTECCTFFVFGWSAFEHVWKKREGPKGEIPSQYDDGLIAPRKLAIRGQTSLAKWEFDEGGGIRGLWQNSASFQQVFVPIEKLLLFRTREAKGNPEGRSILLNAYRPYFFKKNVEQIEGVGVERDLAGLPVMYVPIEVLTNPALSSIKDACDKIVRNVRRDEQEGILMPRDPIHPEAYELKLLSTGGTRQFNTTEIVNRHTAHMMIALLTDFLLVGHEQAGSYALIESKQETARTAAMGYLVGMAGVLSRHLVTKSIDFNSQAFPGLTRYPRLEVSLPKVPSVEEIMTAIDSLAKAGADLFPNLNLVNRVLQEVGLPGITEAEAAEAAMGSAEEGVEGATLAGRALKYRLPYREVGGVADGGRVEI